MDAERPHEHPAVTEDRKGTQHPKEDTNQGTREVVIARVTANWLQRNTRDDSQDGAKKEVKSKEGEEDDGEGLYEAGGGGWTVGSGFLA
ncbi:hypothetical protein MKX08_010024 [Trichoderma sp. CBMAI-0020]|nr:hypothetical protein MKX08_010024 [Trichoderma sp. CBMAI-0020]